MLVEQKLRRHRKRLPSGASLRQSVLKADTSPAEDIVNLVLVVAIPGHDGFDDLHREMEEIFHHALDVAIVELDIGEDVMDGCSGSGQGRLAAAPVRVPLDLNH